MSLGGWLELFPEEADNVASHAPSRGVAGGSPGLFFIPKEVARAPRAAILPVNPAAAALAPDRLGPVARRVQRDRVIDIVGFPDSSSPAGGMTRIPGAGRSRNLAGRATPACLPFFHALPSRRRMFAPAGVWR